MIACKTTPVRFVRAAERGMVLLMALIVLVAVMVAGIAMMRSVDTATLVSGNLAFQQSATYASDKGVEAALAMLQQKSTDGLLGDNDPTSGYYATFGGSTPATGTSWQSFWDSNFATVAVDVLPGADQFGNRVLYVVHRQCRDSGPSASATCLKPPPKTTGTGGAGSDLDGGGGGNNIAGNSQVYYRITVRVAGPRRTESYVQTNVAL